jgi:fumarylacetoacetase
MTVAYGVLRARGGDPSVCARVDGRVLDLSGLGDEFRRPSLNAFMACGREFVRETTERVRGLDGPEAHGDELLPIEVADYADFSLSPYHMANMSSIIRPGSEGAPPQVRWMPIAYHGRSATIVPSGTDVPRPRGQWRDGDETRYGPEPRLDIELETAFVIGTPSERGKPVATGDALDHVFGLVLLNDWSARSIQLWESVLGPFLGKSFASTISNWVVPIDELADYRAPLDPQDPPPVEYLQGERVGYDIELEAEINGTVVTRTSSKHLYWNIEQMVAHTTVNGASLRTGDLLGSGTVSGPTDDSLACLMELTADGKRELRLDDGSTRHYLEDGDEVVLRAPQLGLEARGRITP